MGVLLVFGNLLQVETTLSVCPPLANENSRPLSPTHQRGKGSPPDVSGGSERYLESPSTIKVEAPPGVPMMSGRGWASRFGNAAVDEGNAMRGKSRGTSG